MAYMRERILLDEASVRLEMVPTGKSVMPSS
jgi:hypothetical protein